ncbi:hypothetical protein BS78_02G104800 [Paspalum vaginatum]|nr:hypothetical protein BS78_02G104800 [Paspalum vaginatum]
MGLAQGDTPRKKKHSATKEYVKKLEYNTKLTAMCDSMEHQFKNVESWSSSKFIDQPIQQIMLSTQYRKHGLQFNFKWACKCERTSRRRIYTTIMRRNCCYHHLMV